MSHNGDEVSVSFHPIPSPEVQEEILTSAVNNSQASDKSEETSERPRFGSQPNFNDPNFDFAKELE